MIKEPRFLAQIVAYAPALVAAAFDLAEEFALSSRDHASVLDSVLNLVRCLREHLEAESILCCEVFQRSMRVLAIAGDNQSLIDPLLEVFNIVVVYSPVFFADFWAPFGVIPPMQLVGLSLYNAAFLLHNLMMRDPGKVPECLSSFLESAHLGVDDWETLVVYNSALFSAAIPGMVPAEYIERLYAVLNDLEPEPASIAPEVAVTSQFFLSLLLYDPRIVIPQLEGVIRIWREVADEIDCACAFALYSHLLEPEERERQFREFFREGLDAAKEEEEDDGRLEFEDDSLAVQIRAIPIVSRQRVRAIFMEYLKRSEEEKDGGIH
jgi:hypothetical protein